LTTLCWQKSFLSNQLSHEQKTVRIYRLNLVQQWQKSVLKKCLKSQKIVPKHMQFERKNAFFILRLSPVRGGIFWQFRYKFESVFDFLRFLPTYKYWRGWGL
jgi:hypothetical protein